jgi:hypothetical protein
LFCCILFPLGLGEKPAPRKSGFTKGLSFDSAI